MEDLLVSCPECMVPNEVSMPSSGSLKTTLKKPGSDDFEEKTIKCSNCNESYTVYLSDSRE